MLASIPRPKKKGRKRKYRNNDNGCNDDKFDSSHAILCFVRSLHGFRYREVDDIEIHVVYRLMVLTLSIFILYFNEKITCTGI